MEITSRDELAQCVGGLVTPAVLLAYLMVAAGVAGIYKILTSRTGKLTITGITFSWSK